MQRIIDGLFWGFFVSFIATVAVSFCSVAHASGCDSDIDCASHTIETCEWTQEPYSCGFDGLPDNAIQIACGRESWAPLACQIYLDELTGESAAAPPGREI